MTDRSDIFPTKKSNWRRLSYTRRCGWVDWGHALPGNALSLKTQLENESPSWPHLGNARVLMNDQPGFVINYGMAMTLFSAERHWIIRRGLSPAWRESAALGIFISASYEFETAQLNLFSWSNSGFSVEDLVSNLIGFYRAFRNIDEDRMRAICGEVPMEESLRLWDEHLPNGFNALKNRSFKPLLFPTREKEKDPFSTTFPALFSSIRPSPNGIDWVRLRDRYIPGQLVNAGATLSVDSKGVLSVLG